MPETTDNIRDDDQLSTIVDTGTGQSTDQPDLPPDTESTDDNDGDTGSDTAPETFPREYVEELRAENARYRTQAKAADDLAQRLHVALVAATGRLADPTDLPFEQAHLDNSEALAAAVDGLLEQKPHLRSRKPVGDVGQGAGGERRADVDLLGMLRSRAN